jgi:hypothetical protein
MKTYTIKDYKSGDGMLTTVWGPSLWHFLHTMSFNYPIEPTKEEQIEYMRFIHQLKYVLPCKRYSDIEVFSEIIFGSINFSVQKVKAFLPGTHSF